VPVTKITGGMAVALAMPVNPRPEIVLPPGFALRIDYDPESSPASLLITAYRDDAPVGQAHLDPREVGQRLRLEVDLDDAAASGASEQRLRLTPQRAMRAIVMGAVHEPAPPRALHPPAEEGVAVTRASEVVPDAHTPPAMEVLRELARAGAFDECVDVDGERPWSRIQRVLRAISGVAVDLLGDPLRLRAAEVAGWPSWRESWRAVHQASGASEG